MDYTKITDPRLKAAKESEARAYRTLWNVHDINKALTDEVERLQKLVLQLGGTEEMLNRGPLRPVEPGQPAR